MSAPENLADNAARASAVDRSSAEAAVFGWAGGTYRRILCVVFSLYIVSTWCSMAGMEIFGWTTFALVLGAAFRGTNGVSFKRVLADDLPWKAMIGLYAVTIFGIFWNGKPGVDWLDSIGNQRWMFLVCTHTFALVLVPLRFKYYRFFLIFISVVGVYAIYQSFTGFDFLRMHDAEPHRAVQPLDVRKEIRLWRSAGLFGSPMGYVYIAGMQACLALAVALVLPRAMKRERLWSALAFVIVALSLITTYVRGAWIAMAIAYLVMALLASRRLFFWAVGLGATAFAVLFVGLIQFRERFMSLFNMDYASNGDRIGLWKMNWRMFLDYPLFGIGWLENENRACDYVDCNAVPKPFTGHAHNNYLQSLAGTGITGFACFMFIIGFFLWLNYRLWKRLPQDLVWARALTLACMGAQVQLHIGGFTECNFKAGATNHNMMVVYALLASMTFLETKGLLRKAYPPVSYS
jgi:O-antigen ligase